MKISEEQLKRTTNVFSNYAKEQVRVEIIEDYLYVFGSELACLRIFYKCYDMEEARVEQSINLNSWFYSQKTVEKIEMP